MVSQKSLSAQSILSVIDAVAQEKGIDKLHVVDAIEQAIKKAVRGKYGQDHDIRVRVDMKVGDIFLERHLIPVDGKATHINEINIKEACLIDKNAQVGVPCIEILDPVDFGRMAAQVSKQVISQKIREAEKMREYEEYKDKKFQIVYGAVKRVEYGNVIVDLGFSVEGFLSHKHLIPREKFDRGDRVRAYIYDVSLNPKGFQIFLSRTDPGFLVALFTQEVPEIYKRIIEIKAVARDPGSHAKIVVASSDSTIDPVGSCIGARGCRVQAVVKELCGEKIDIIPWNEDVVTFLLRAFHPAEVKKVVLDEDKKVIDMVVDEKSYSIAIGRRGQNVRLISKLIAWRINILSPEEDEKGRKEEEERSILSLCEALGIDDTFAAVLFSYGFASPEDLLLATEDDLLRIKALDSQLIEELKDRAREFLSEEKSLYFEGVDDAVCSLESIFSDMEDKEKILNSLKDGEIFTLESFAGLDMEDLFGDSGILSQEKVDQDLLAKKIVVAREKCGWFNK